MLEGMCGPSHQTKLFNTGGNANFKALVQTHKIVYNGMYIFGSDKTISILLLGKACIL